MFYHYFFFFREKKTEKAAEMLPLGKKTYQERENVFCSKKRK